MAFNFLYSVIRSIDNYQIIVKNRLANRLEVWTVVNKPGKNTIYYKGQSYEFSNVYLG